MASQWRMARWPSSSTRSWTRQLRQRGVHGNYAHGQGRPTLPAPRAQGAPPGRSAPAQAPPQELASTGVLGSGWLLQQSLIMFSASSVLGPLCDGQHSSHDVLHYDEAPASRPWQLDLWLLHLETSWWVPVMFGLAGLVLGVGHPLLDAWLPGSCPRHGASPTWKVVLLGITAFVLQYWASGALEQPLQGTHVGPVPALDAFLAATAVANWWVFDGTRQGLGMACLTALAGPALEIFIINSLHLYHYCHPAFFGIPSWIAWVYFCGAPAVGNLGRRVSATILGQAGHAA